MLISEMQFNLILFGALFIRFFKVTEYIHNSEVLKTITDPRIHHFAVSNDLKNCVKVGTPFSQSNGSLLISVKFSMLRYRNNASYSSKLSRMKNIS